MGQITVYAAVANAAARMNPGRERRIMERLVEMLDFNRRAEDTEFPQSQMFGQRVIEFEDDESTQQIGHICPHCKREPIAMAMHILNFGGVPAFVFSCSGCRKVISVSVPPPPPAASPEQRSSLVLPGRSM